MSSANFARCAIVAGLMLTTILACTGPETRRETPSDGNGADADADDGNGTGDSGISLDSNLSDVSQKDIKGSDAQYVLERESRATDAVDVPHQPDGDSVILDGYDTETDSTDHVDQHDPPDIRVEVDGEIRPPADTSDEVDTTDVADSDRAMDSSRDPDTGDTAISSACENWLDGLMLAPTYDVCEKTRT